MTPDHVRVRSYFSPPAKSYWHWQDRGRVAVWKDEVTISFREELETILTGLATKGLPPLGSVLLLLAACRDGWEQAPNRRTLLHTHLGLLYGGGYADLLTEVLTGLGKIHRSRDLVRASVRAKTLLAAMLFEDAPGRFSPDESQFLVERFQLRLAEDELDWKPQSALDDLVHDLGCLRWGLSRLDLDNLGLRLKTGLDGAPQPAPVQPPPPASARDLIVSLLDDPELGAVARLAQLLLAAVQLPRAVSDPDELPVGGLSDIVNRGPLDRLLLSELAHDDLTLAVRVAMNEALYLRRESPPRTPPRRRRILLDAGLRTWGMPRVFVTAVGLALAAKVESQLAVEAFRAAGSDAVPIDLQSSVGLHAHLAALDHHLHPAGAVQALTADSNGPTGADDESDLIVVTTDDTLADAEFQRGVQDAAGKGLYLAAVSREGRFQLLHRGWRGSKVICQAKFDLDDVLRPPPRTSKLYDQRRDEQLPAFIHQSSLPLRFSCPVDLARAWYVHPGTVISYVRDGRLLLWDHADKGARQISSGGPEDGNLLWCDSQWDTDRVRLVIGKRSRRGMQAVTYDRRTGSVNVGPLVLPGASSDHPVDVLGLPGAILIIFHDSALAFDWADGQLLATRMNFRLPHRQGRFVSYKVKDQTETEWRALTYRPGRGDHSLGEEFVCRDAAAGDQLLAILAPMERERLIGLTVSGAIRSVAEEPAILVQPHPQKVLQPPYSLLGVSRDGRRVLLTGSSSSHSVSQAVLDVQNGRLLLIANCARRDVLERPLFDFARPRIVHTRFRAIGIGSEGQLSLLSRRGMHWPLLFEVGQRTIRFPRQPRDAGSSGPLKSTATFEAVESFKEGFSLEAARWADGSRAWLDGRGLLHLRSSDASIPECTLVLTDGPLAGWLSSGHVFGPPYWLDTEGPAISAREVWETVLRPFASKLA